MTITSWLVIVMGNLTVALEYMPIPEVNFVPKSVYLNVCLVAYLLTSFAITRFNKPEYEVSGAYMAGRLVACALIVGIAALTNFDPLVTLVVDTFAVYLALAYEMVLDLPIEEDFLPGGVMCLHVVEDPLKALVSCLLVLEKL